jgi:hypothetical protein
MEPITRALYTEVVPGRSWELLASLLTGGVALQRDKHHVPACPALQAVK